MSFAVKVDPTNPGQFFACCGLLELADRLWPGAEGWFAGDSFHVRNESRPDDVKAPALMRFLLDASVTNTMTPEQWARFHELDAMSGKQRSAGGCDDEKGELDSAIRTYPVVLRFDRPMRIDWFLDDETGGSRLKTWAGMQSVLRIVEAMHNAARAGGVWVALPSEQWLQQGSPSPELPFYLDSDFGSQASTVDTGFSTNTLDIRSPTRPMIELAGFVGLQRFRPLYSRELDRYDYALWGEPLPPAVAAAACCGAVDAVGARRYGFRLLYRTKYLKSFLPASPLGA